MTSRADAMTHVHPGTPPRRLAIKHVRALGALAAVAVFVGVWAQLAPSSFHGDFPGLRRAWVSLDGPYNEHLVRDVGGLPLALAFVTIAAARSASARLARAAAAAWLVYALPHLGYHAAQLEPFPVRDAAAQTVALALQVIVPIWVLTAAGRSADTGRRRPPGGRSEHRAHGPSLHGEDGDAQQGRLQPAQLRRDRRAT